MNKKFLLLPLALSGLLFSACPTWVDVGPMRLIQKGDPGVSSVTFEWELPVGMESEPHSFILRRYRTGHLTAYFEIKGTETSYTDTTLEGSCTYTYTIEPQYWSPCYTVESNQVIVTTPEDSNQSLGVPVNFVAFLTPLDPRRVDLKWDPVDGAVSYQIDIYCTEVFEESIEVAAVNSLRLNSLCYGNTWQFTIKALGKAGATYSKTSPYFKLNIPYRAFPSAALATPLLVNQDEKFILKSELDSKTIWGHFVPGVEPFTIEVDSEAIVWRLYQKNDDGSLSFIGSGPGGQAPGDLVPFTGLEGVDCYISFYLASVSQRDIYFTAHIIQGEQE